jgi:predicted transcriptional regulator of viral defense system
MMRHLKRQYYVSFLSAASLHGASHQSPQAFGVVVSKHLDDRDIERIHLRFVASEHVEDMRTEQRTVQTGYLTVATPETTAVDLAWRPALGGGISNVATVLKELGDLNAETLGRLARVRGRATARRLGWLLERFRPDLDSYWLRVIADPDHGTPTWLIPGKRRGNLDKGWGIRINATLEPDV